MERLTKRMSGISHSMCENVIIARCENCQNRQPGCYSEDCTADIEVMQKLAEYEDAEEQGLLVRLPCKVGDTVYFNLGIKTEECKVVGYSSPIMQFLYEPTDQIFGSAVAFIGKPEYGGYVFLTREEAEAALTADDRKSRTSGEGG